MALKGFGTCVVNVVRLVDVCGDEVIIARLGSRNKG